MNKASERYDVNIEIPVSVILETIFTSDNHDTETLCRYALKNGFIDLIEKEGQKYYQIQEDYDKQSFYTLLNKEERKQYEYEDYLIDEAENLKERIDKALEHINIKQIRFLNEKDYILNDEDLDEIMQILKGEDNE